MSDFDQLIGDIENEAQAEGPEAVAELRAYREQFRLASEVLTLRREANLTQKELAKRAGIQQADISRIERGEIAPTGPTFGKLADALGVGFGFYRPVARGVVEPIRPLVAKPRAQGVRVAGLSLGRGAAGRAKGVARRTGVTASRTATGGARKVTATASKSTSSRSGGGRSGATKSATSRSGAKKAASGGTTGTKASRSVRKSSAKRSGASRSKS